MIPLLLGLTLLGYVLGSIPFGLLLTRYYGAGDLRSIGSGNIGATNVLRTGRRGLAAATLALDALKGAVAVLVALAVAPLFAARAEAFAAVAVVVGHCFPIWLKFRGGKGVATGLGAVLALSPITGLLCCVIWLAVARLSRISSAGALAAFVAMPWMLAPLRGEGFGSPVALAGFVIALLVLARHHANIRRLLAGQESRIGGR
ncbi:glycerol-3-phosphate 1-O-acyltransferase PlsY [Ameyamaea chiangmaiensis]|uniref:Glycerol-3-phosphate acyltransferase n=2 Tax=Ameyamaea chiangmaiensis TaxID=442969 RepID=A0A850PIG3_9PROT|nr:glycerol-3-phosphate 1-O-acyltransferase PlsY [Ameyamaea chiangmaiensis]NVN42180.1 glycerol-3-phosphate 1-O-acyltransferase PlsY [Ameyamaea chiangmaiensis]